MSTNKDPIKNSSPILKVVSHVRQSVVTKASQIYVAFHNAAGQDKSASGT